MEALQNRLQQLENATGSDIWSILRESENDLLQDVVSLKELKEEKERKNRESLRLLQEKKKELVELRKGVENLKNEYKNHIKAVEDGLKANGLDIKKVVEVFEKALEDSLRARQAEIVSTLCPDDLASKSIDNLHEPLKNVLQILEDQKQTKLRSMIATEISEFHIIAVEICRRECWSLFQKHGLPIKPLDVKSSESSDFLDKFHVISQFSADLDRLLTASNSETIGNLTSTAFGHLINISLDMIESEKGDADFEWILTCGHRWAENLKKVIEVAVEHLNIDKKWKTNLEKTFKDKFVGFVHRITTAFVQKNLKDPLIFSKLSSLFRRFQEDEDLSDKDLFQPLYAPEFMSKWILLEIELFTFSVSKLLGSTDEFHRAHCFEPLPAISIGSSISPNWASDITVFFEQWLTRVDRDVSCFGDFEIQKAFYEAMHLLMIDTSRRIRDTTTQLYAESSWSNDVYLVMNTMWELRRIVSDLTVTWPISSFEVEEAYEKEWRRLAGMISDYLDELVDSLDKTVKSTYMGNSEKIRRIEETFYHILKCLKNVGTKASKPSMSPLMDILVVELFQNFQKKFDKWNAATVDILAIFYLQIYSNLLLYLDAINKSSEWIRGSSARAEMCRLDALMKVAANRDPSGELVRAAFKSIDEEQVMKMLAELGIHATSDHAFQDFQILAENWEKIKDKGYDN